MDVDCDESISAADANHTSTLVHHWQPRQCRHLATDYFFEAGDLACCLRCHKFTCLSDPTSCSSNHSVISCQQPMCLKTFSSLLEYEMHYSIVHRFVCSKCNRCFPTQHLLDVHLLEWHDSVFQLQVNTHKMFCCLVESCQEHFQMFNDRTRHMVSFHKFPSAFRFVKKPTKCANSSVTMETESECHLSHSAAASSAHVTQTAQRNARVPRTICFGRGVSRGFQHKTQSSRHVNSAVD